MGNTKSVMEWKEEGKTESVMAALGLIGLKWLLSMTNLPLAHTRSKEDRDIKVLMGWKEAGDESKKKELKREREENRRIEENKKDRICDGWVRIDPSETTLTSDKFIISIHTF